MPALTHLAIALAATLALLAVAALGWIRLHARHRALKRTLTRVAQERDQARWRISDAGQPHHG